MPRKPWIKLSTQIILSSTWQATTPNKGIVEFIALLTLADDTGTVEANVVKGLAKLLHADSRSVARHLHALSHLHTICLHPDGKITIPKYLQYQYLQGFRSDKHPPKLGTSPSQEQSRTEQNRVTLDTDVSNVSKSTGATAPLFPGEKETPSKKAPPQKPRAAGPPPNPDVRVFLDWFAQRWGQVHNAPYEVHWGKDGATVKRLLASRSLDALKALADRMLTNPSDWARNAGCTIGVLSSEVNRLQAESRPSREYRDLDAELRAKLEADRKTTQKGVRP